MRLLCVLSALLLVAPGSPDLLQRAAQASGQPWRYHIVSRLADGQTHVDEQGDEVLTRRCNGIVCIGTFVDAARSRIWAVSYNDATIPQSSPLDPAQVTLRTIVSYGFTSSEFVAAGGTVVALARRTLGNLQVAPYAVTAPHGTRLDALLDPRTGLLTGVARGLDVIYRYEGQRRVGPCTLPFTIRRGDDTMEVYADRQLASQPLAFPSGPPVTFAAPGALAHLEPGSLFRFGCRIEGVPARCVLDTGASGLAMSLDLADHLGKKLLGQVELQGLGPVATAVVHADSLAMGGMRLGPALYAVIPDTGGLGADVIVGSDALARAVVRVDPRRHTVVFAPAGTPLAGTTLPLLFDGQIPRVPIVLGTNSVDLVLDTGDDASIDVNAPFLEQHPGLVRIRGHHAVVGVGGRGIVPAGSIARVDFGGINLSDVAADVNDLAQHPAPRIGAAFLAHFAFDMDYTEGRMSVRPLR